MKCLKKILTETISCQYNTIIKTGGATGAMTEIIINLDIPLKQTLWYN